MALHVGLRVVGRLVLYRSLGQPLPWSDTWLVPVRDVVSFVVGILSFLGRTVRWNDERFRVRRDGRLERRVATGYRQRLAGSAEAPPPASKWEESARRTSIIATSEHCSCIRPRTRASTAARGRDITRVARSRRSGIRRHT